MSALLRLRLIAALGAGTLLFCSACEKKEETPLEQNTLEQREGAPGGQAAEGQLPPGHPPIEQPSDQVLPPGHPPVEQPSEEKLPPGHPPVEKPGGQGT